jgi:hypothetical protein
MQQYTMHEATSNVGRMKTHAAAPQNSHKIFCKFDNKITNTLRKLPTLPEQNHLQQRQ